MRPSSRCWTRRVCTPDVANMQVKRSIPVVVPAPSGNARALPLERDPRGGGGPDAVDRATGCVHRASAELHVHRVVPYRSCSACIRNQNVGRHSRGGIKANIDVAPGRRGCRGDLRLTRIWVVQRDPPGLDEALTRTHFVPTIVIAVVSAASTTIPSPKVQA